MGVIRRLKRTQRGLKGSGRGAEGEQKGSKRGAKGERKGSGRGVEGERKVSGRGLEGYPANSFTIHTKMLLQIFTYIHQQ